MNQKEVFALLTKASLLFLLQQAVSDEKWDLVKAIVEEIKTR
jgi:hypothetical protein